MNKNGTTEELSLEVINHYNTDFGTMYHLKIFTSFFKNIFGQPITSLILHSCVRLKYGPCKLIDKQIREKITVTMVEIGLNNGDQVRRLHTRLILTFASPSMPLHT